MSPRKPTLEPAVPDRIGKAVDVLEGRQNGLQEPEGGWADRVWLPSDGERRSCCVGLEPDKIKDPQKLRSHCRTVLHIANLFDLDPHLLRMEIRRRRLAREALRGEPPRKAVEGKDAGLRLSRLAKSARTSPPTGSGSAEATALHAKLVRLVADKRADLHTLTGQAVERFGELHRLLADEGLEIEVILAESGAEDLAFELQGLIDDIKNLAITRDTIGRVL